MRMRMEDPNTSLLPVIEKEREGQTEGKGLKGRKGRRVAASDVMSERSGGG